MAIQEYFPLLLVLQLREAFAHGKSWVHNPRKKKSGDIHLELSRSTRIVQGGRRDWAGGRGLGSTSERVPCRCTERRKNENDRSILAPSCQRPNGPHGVPRQRGADGGLVEAHLVDALPEVEPAGACPR